MTEIALRRLRAQRLIGPACPSAVHAVRWLGAVQSQDYGAAKWALGQRALETTEAEIDRLYDQGAILRTHAMRPTWHFVLPEDVRWLLDLTGPRVSAGLRGRLRQLEIDQQTVARARAAVTDALAGGRHLTRPELGDVLVGAGISPEGQRLPHLLLDAELAQVIVSGPRRGRQFTYALFDERVPAARTLDRPEAVAELTRRYFRSHGPAQVQDFVWWSGLTVADARAGIEVSGSALERAVIAGKEHWFDAEAGAVSDPTLVAHLLPNFDEYTVAYRDRASALHPDQPLEASLFSYGSILSNVLTIGGRVRGAWRRQSGSRGAVRLELRLPGALRTPEVKAVQEAVARLSRFVERPVEVGGL